MWANFYGRTWNSVLIRFGENGLVEKIIGVLVDRMAAFVDEENAMWDLVLEDAVFSINTSFQSSLKMSLFQFLYGFVPTLPVDTLFPRHEEDQDINLDERTAQDGLVR